MTMAPFIGRRLELDELRQQAKKRTSSLIVVKGRRRIGKSRLIEEFGKSAKFYSFSGLPPTETCRPPGRTSARPRSPCGSDHCRSRGIAS